MATFTEAKDGLIIHSNGVPGKSSEEKRSFIDHVESFSNRFWLVELFAVLLSWFIIAIILAGIGHLNNKPILVYRWSGYSYTVLVLLSTLLRAALMIPVVGSLGQLKWHHFRGKDVKNLRVMETFSEATSGFFGSLKLLMMLKLVNFACLGAIITILAFFVPVLTQQALATVDGGRSDNQTWIQRNSQYTMTTLFERRDGIIFPPSDVTNSFIFAMSRDTTNQLGAFQYGLWSCTSANCQYPKFQSLSVQSQCVDLTDKISSSGSVISHPSDPSLLLFPNTAVNSTTTLKPPPKNLYKYPVGLLLGRWLIMGRSIGLNPTRDIIAAECVFYWAVTTYNSSVEDSGLKENNLDVFVDYTANGTWVLDPTSDGVSLTVPWSYVIRPDPCYADGMVISSSDPRCAFSIYGTAQQGLINYFTLDGGYSLRGAATVQNNGYWNRTFEYNTQFIFFMLEAFGDVSRDIMVERVGRLAYQGAQMLTTLVRQQPISGYSPETYVYDHITGTQTYEFAIYQARWSYMGFTIALTALSSLFFAVTTFLTKDEQKWKNSFVAALFHGLAHEESLRHGEVRTLQGMKIAAEGLLVRLEDTTHGEKLVSKYSLLP